MQVAGCALAQKFGIGYNGKIGIGIDLADDPFDPLRRCVDFVCCLIIWAADDAVCSSDGGLIEGRSTMKSQKQSGFPSCERGSPILILLMNLASFCQTYN